MKKQKIKNKNLNYTCEKLNNSKTLNLNKIEITYQVLVLDTTQQNSKFKKKKNLRKKKCEGGRE